MTVDERKSGLSTVHFMMLKVGSITPEAVPASIEVKRALSSNSGAEPRSVPVGTYWLSSAGA